MEANAAVRSNMRVILRHLRTLPSAKVNEPKVLHVLHQFRQGKKETNEFLVSRMRENAQCYATLVASIKELRYLRGLDTGDKLAPRDHINATAARVGFSMPSFSDKLSDGDFDGPLPPPKIIPSRFTSDTHFGQQPVLAVAKPSAAAASADKK
jgi:hypothetical protein